MIGFVVAGEVFLLLPNADEPLKVIFMGLFITFGSAVIATAASLFERLLQNAVGMTGKS
jgi:hypothetical protein